MNHDNPKTYDWSKLTTKSKTTLKWALITYFCSINSDQMLKVPFIKWLNGWYNWYWKWKYELNIEYEWNCIICIVGLNRILSINLTLCTFLKWALYARRAIMARHQKFTLLSLLVDSNSCGHLLWYQTHCILSNKAPERPWYGHQRPQFRVKFKNIFHCRAIMARRA